jgi:hypothetical protein
MHCILCKVVYKILRMYLYSGNALHTSSHIVALLDAYICIGKEHMVQTLDGNNGALTPLFCRCQIDAFLFMFYISVAICGQHTLLPRLYT